MHHAERVALGDAFTGLNDVVDRLGDRQRPAHLEHLGQVRSAQVLAHHVGRAGLEPTDVGHARDVLTLNPHRRPRFAHETLYELGIGAGFGHEELQRYFLAQLQVTHLNHDAEAVAAWNALDAVLSGQHLSLTDDVFGAFVATHERRPARGLVVHELVVEDHFSFRVTLRHDVSASTAAHAGRP